MLPSLELPSLNSHKWNFQLLPYAGFSSGPLLNWSWIIKITSRPGRISTLLWMCQIHPVWYAYICVFTQCPAQGSLSSEKVDLHWKRIQKQQSMYTSNPKRGSLLRRYFRNRMVKRSLSAVFFCHLFTWGFWSSSLQETGIIWQSWNANTN